MTEKNRHNFTVIENTEHGSNTEKQITPTSNYHTNPMYEKLLNYHEKQKKKRFTVEDLLKWC